MTEYDEGGGKWVGPFLLGVIVGALLMLGIGGGLWMVQAGRMREAAMDAERAHMEELMARERAEEARLETERALLMAEKARQEAEHKKDGKK
jgi:hypothetical protein